MKQIKNENKALEIYREFVQKNDFAQKIQDYIDDANLEEIYNAISNNDVLDINASTVRAIATNFFNTQLYNFLCCKKDDRKTTFKNDYAELKEKEERFIKLKKSFTDLYHQLTDKQKGIAYSIINALGIRACPYCNLNYIDPVIKEDGTNVVRHHLDHFYPKKYFPFLAVSFYNLIPSCYECNSGLKKDQADFDLYYPYLDDFDDDAIFLTTFSGNGNLSYLFDDLTSFKIFIHSRKPTTAWRVINQIKKFCLKERYSYRKEEARNILFHKALTTPEALKEIKILLELKGVSDKELKEMLLMNSLNKEDINNRPLSKLTQDLCLKNSI